MNRGRRRGGPGLTGLRDGVKRRLFDPHSVPTKPDAKYEVNRLVPLTSTKPLVHSLLSLRAFAASGDSSVIGTQEEEQSHSDKLRKNLFKSKAMLQLAFRNGPFYHTLPERSEGIDLARTFHGAQAAGSSVKENTAVLLSHLLLAHEDIKQWGDGELLKDLENPDSWYPKEVVQFTKFSKKTLARQRARKRLTQQQAIANRTVEAAVKISTEGVVEDLSVPRDVDEVLQQEEGARSSTSGTSKGVHCR
ncbi:hypothetical protein CLF_107555 [Clonorchis sinensis]|uniref:Uncharacterized protein n=1 Tax=Clonorchis sinensis TaxID=79923 RepID=G7YQS6_CLOSI|nr:hypothetical protein CLF_107555 [Clonorchis sinensis]